jgi:hypothetical protein
MLAVQTGFCGSLTTVSTFMSMLVFRSVSGIVGTLLMGKRGVLDILDMNMVRALCGRVREQILARGKKLRETVHKRKLLGSQLSCQRSTGACLSIMQPPPWLEPKYCCC